MKKMWNKKGFSLAEVMIVIAIIVILSGATAVGVVSWLNNAKNAQNNVLTNNGDNFENEARLAVESAKGEVPEGIGESVTVNPVTNTPAPVTNTPKPDDPGTNTPKPNQDTPAPVTNTPAPVTNTPAPTTKPQTTSVSYGSTGRPSEGTTTFASDDKSAASGTSVSIQQAGDQYNYCQLNVTVPENCTSFVVYIPGAGNNSFAGYNSNQFTSLGNGYYRVTNPNKVKTQMIYSSTFKGSTGAYVVEYTTT